MNRIIAAVIIALPLMATTLLPRPASAEIIRRPIVAHPVVVAQSSRRVERRVWVAGHWDYSNHHRRWVPGHYEYRR